jgi:hypothetical protein
MLVFRPTCKLHVRAQLTVRHIGYITWVATRTLQIFNRGWCWAYSDVSYAISLLQDLVLYTSNSFRLNARSKLRLALGRGLGDALLDLFFGKDLYRVVGKDVTET